LSEDGQKKPGFPLQVLGFANANPVGFPLQSLARQIRIKPGNCLWQFPGRIIAKGNYAHATRLEQFCWSKLNTIEWSGRTYVLFQSSVAEDIQRVERIKKMLPNYIPGEEKSWRY
jgi:hypothetical protein